MLTTCAIVLHDRGMRQRPLRIDMSIEQAADVWLSRYTAANTRAAYSSDLKAFLSWIGDDTAAMVATPDDLSRYRAEREALGLNTSTVDRQFAALRAFFATACELGACADNPFGARSGPATATSATETLTADETARLEAAAALDPRTAVLVRLLLGEGMRLAEVLALDHADVSGSRHAKRLRIVRHGGPVSVVLDRAGSRSVGKLVMPTSGSPTMSVTIRKDRVARRSTATTHRRRESR